MITTTNTVVANMPLTVLRVLGLATYVPSNVPIQIIGFVPCEALTSDCRPTEDCEFHIDVFADATSNDLHNDKSTFLFEYMTSTDSAVFKVESYSAGVWTEVITVTDNTYGLFYDLGTLADFPLYAGMYLYWKNVFAALGEGCYRFKVESTILGSDSTLYSPMFCLHEWTCDGTNRTVRFDAWMNHKIGSITDDNKIFDLGTLNW